MIQELCGIRSISPMTVEIKIGTLFLVNPPCLGASGLKFTELKTGLRETYESENIGH